MLYQSLIFKLKLTVLIIALFPFSKALGQELKKNDYIDISLIGSSSSDKAVPFWMRSNQFGSIPLTGTSASLLISAGKKLHTENNEAQSLNKFQWGYGLEFRGNIGNKARIQLIEANVKFKYSIIETSIGRTKDIMGLNGDSSLTSGNFAVSGNALGIPKLDIGVNEYRRLPWLEGLISLKGNIAIGHLGKKLIDTRLFLNMPKDNNVNTFYHQKSLYGRIGKEDWKVNFIGGISHQAQFGNEKQVYENDYSLTAFQTIWHVFWGLPYGTDKIEKSKIGNQLGSIDLGFSYDWENVQLLAYRQNFYDVGAISKLANIKDGLNGMTLTNKRFSKEKKSFDWHRLLLEFFYSKDQAGYPWSKPTKSGDEDYYNNYYYTEGWSYKNLGLGTPLIIAANTVKPGHANDPYDYFISNRVIAGHFGARFSAWNWLINSKLTISKHFGTFSTSEYGKSTGQKRHPPYKDQFVPVTQFSSYLQGEKELKNNYYLGLTLAWDQGSLLYKGLAGQVSIRKSIF